MTSRMRPWISRVAVAGQCSLVVLGVAWAVLEKPAPVFTVDWRDGLSDDARRAAELQLHLENGQVSDEARQYELWSPRPADIAAVIAHPDIEDTQHIDRNAATISADAGRGERRVWWAGPFRGGRSRTQFRVVFGVIGVVTLLGTLFVRQRKA